ncbi:MAG: alpha/beta hydrolase family protein [Parvibaculaceae bacterium]
MFQYWTDDTRESVVFSFHLVWLFYEAVQGGADTNELFHAVRKVRAGNAEDWHTAFVELGERIEKIATEADAAGHDVTAGQAWWRAFTYFRSAERVLKGKDPRKLPLYQRTTECFYKGIDKQPHPYERIAIQFDGRKLDGLFLPPRSKRRGTPPPVIIFPTGADALPEEQLFRGAQEMTARGAAVLLFNGPGQGKSIRILGLPTIPDYERVFTAAVDYLMTRTDIDHDRIGLIGGSMAGYYAPRAVSFEHRIKACVVWGALYDVLRDLYEPYPPLHEQLQWITGTNSDEEARAYLADFNLQGNLANVKCPMLVTHGARDHMVPASSAQRLFDELPVADKTLRIYDDEIGGSGHCSVDNWTQVVAYQIDWVLDRLG